LLIRVQQKTWIFRAISFEGTGLMRTVTLIAVALATVAAGSGAAQASPVYVAPSPFSAVYVPYGQPLLIKAQYVYGGRNYCWYDGGWKGPGYYWCGYAGRYGLGWGGGWGWNHWSGGHRGGGYHGAGYAVSRGHFDHGGSHSVHGGGGGHGGGHSGGGGHGGGHGGGEHHH
jgi:hypothetical protein